MRIQAIGHAGLGVEHDDHRVLLDPWFSPEGAFQGSWFQYPNNEHLIDDELFEPDAIVISHEHIDHVDPWFLARVPAEVPVFVPTYPSPVLCDKIRAAGERRIVELQPWRNEEIVPGMSVFFVREESPMNHDAGMVIRANGQCLLNMNDARLSPRQIDRIRKLVGGRIDAMVLQAAGASWYPICYEYPAERIAELALAKRAAKFRYVEQTLRVAEPTVSFPLAGPPCFLDDELRPFNEQLGPTGIFPDQSQALEYLTGVGLTDTAMLLPGDVWDTEGGGREADPHWDGFSFGDRERYIDAYASARADQIAAVKAQHPEPERSLWEPFVEHFETLLGMNEYFDEQIDMRVGFDVAGPGGGQWAVDFRRGSRGVIDELRDCQYTYRLESRWLAPVLDGRVPWEDFFLSLRFRAHRDPDLYNDHLLGLLKFADRSALERVEAYETAALEEAKIVVESDGRTYSIDRYCPHAGQDLSQTGELLPGGIIRCLGHHYEFDLESGECVNGHCRPLSTERQASVPQQGQ